jgi:hypothetical protein
MCASAPYRRLVPVLVGLAGALAWLPAVAHSEVGMFVIAGGGHLDRLEGDAATTRFFQGYSFQGAPAALADGGFLYAEDEARRARDDGRALVDSGRWGGRPPAG